MKTDLDKVPKTLDDAVEMLIAALEPADRAHLDEHGIEGAHFGLGMGLRNGWSLWEPSAPLSALVHAEPEGVARRRYGLCNAPRTLPG